MLNLLGINSVIRCWNVKPWHLPYVYLLRFANSWQGHCNRMSRQLLWAHNSSSPHKRWTTTQRTMSPTLNIQCVGSSTSHRIYVGKSCEKQPTIYHPYPRRLENITVCRCPYKGSTFSSVISRTWVLVWPGLNQKPPAR